MKRVYRVRLTLRWVRAPFFMDEVAWNWPSFRSHFVYDQERADG